MIISTTIQKLVGKIPETQADYIETAEMIGSEIRPFLVALVSDDEMLKTIASGSYSHVNGFDKLILWRWPNAAKCRLHIWWNERPYEEEIHNHRWSFASAIALGRMDATFYSIKEGVGWIPTTCITEQGSYSFEPSIEECDLEITMHARISAGDQYYLHYDQLHSVRTELGTPTVTAIVTTAPVRSKSLVLRQSGSKSVESLPAMRMETTEVRRKIKSVLDIL